MLSDKELLLKIKPYAKESTPQSIWAMVNTVFPYLLSLWMILQSSAIYVQILGAALFILMNVRFFVIFHDFAHGALFREKTLLMKCIRGIMEVYGFTVVLTKELWAETHNRHHQHNSKFDEIFIGQVLILSVNKFKSLNKLQKLGYLIFRHPIIMIISYLTSFLGPALIIAAKNPWQKIKIIGAIVMHVLILTLIYQWKGLNTFLIYMSALVLSAIVLKYLFNLQHAFPEAKYLGPDEWTMVKAASETTSFLKMSRVGHFFTGNIGFHHIHHLNPRIPFYRLPEVMREVTEMQNPLVVTWKARDVFGILFGTAAWDEDSKQMVSFSKLLQLAK